MDQQTQALALRNGNHLFRQVCEKTPDMITLETARRWVAEEDWWESGRADFAARCAETLRDGGRGRTDGTEIDLGWLVVFSIEAYAEGTIDETTLQLAQAGTGMLFTPITTTGKGAPNDH